MILHVALQNESANLARLADTLADEQLEDGDYDEATFDRIISDTTALAVRLLDHVGDHIAADAVRAS